MLSFPGFSSQAGPIPLLPKLILILMLGLSASLVFWVAVVPFIGIEKVATATDQLTDLNLIQVDLNNFQNPPKQTEPFCGNRECEPGETADTCFLDCFACNENNSCEADIGENTQSCPNDCPPPVCNNDKICDVRKGETAANCPKDCKGGGGGGGGGSGGGGGGGGGGDPGPGGPPSPVCGDSSCNGGETCTSCASDCGACSATCGNSVCDSTETCNNCSSDCGACPATCGDLSCNGSETCSTCSQDCGACAPFCGDGTCQTDTETCSSCASDCGTCSPTCGNGTCAAAEDCPADSAACNSAAVCYTSPGVCSNGCVYTPVTQNQSDAGSCDATHANGACTTPPCTCNGNGQCISTCGNGTCATSENCPSDATSCNSPAMCYTTPATCTNGCGYTTIANNQTDAGRCDATHTGGSCTTPPCACNGSGSCIAVSAPPVCSTGQSGSWQTNSFTTQTGSFTVDYDATPHNAGSPASPAMDGVFGLSNGIGTTFSNYAIMVRFNTAGRIDVRNGSTYQQDQIINYSANSTYHTKITVNIPSHTYSVVVTIPSGTQVAVATNYAFRSEQSGVASLDHWGVWAVAGTSVDACSFAMTSTCGNGTCSAAENCAADNSACNAPGTCYANPGTCSNGCQYAPISSGQTQSGVCDATHATGSCATPPCSCNGSGACITTSTCGNGICSTGENCPADATGCTDNLCFEPTCTNGCGQAAVSSSGTDEACFSSTGCTGGNCSCNGSGACISSSPPPTALMPIARWDTVPLQRIDQGQTLNVGVIAFSKYGIQKVVFTPTGKSPVEVTQMTLNPQTGVFEYWFPLSANSFASNGSISVSAAVYGLDGGIRNSNGSDGFGQLPLMVYPQGQTRPEAWVAPSGGSDGSGAVNDSTKPYATIQAAMTGIKNWNSSNGRGSVADGGIIRVRQGVLLMPPGGWGYQPTTSQWLTITNDPATGGNKTNTTIRTSETNNGAIGTEYLKVEGLTLNATGHAKAIFDIGGSGTKAIWINDSIVQGYDRYDTDPHVVSSNWQDIYYTNTSITNVRFAIANGNGVSGTMARGVTITHIGEDAFPATPLIANATLSDQDPGPPGGNQWHADAWQSNGITTNGLPPRNWITYNFKGTDLHYQGIFGRVKALGQNNAFVNVFLELRSPIRDYGEGTTGSWLGGTYDHTLFWNNTFIGTSYIHDFWFANEGYTGTPQFQFTNSSFRGNVFDRWLTTEGIGWTQGSTVEFRDNHYVNTSGSLAYTPGASGSYTTGSGVLITDTGSANFGHPLSSSGLKNRLVPPVPIDIANNIRSSSSATVGAYEN